MNGDYGQRAATALGESLPPRHRAKTVARLFDCSLSMAKYLLAGDHWTIRRLMQASELLGDAFDAAFHAPPSSFQRSLETHDINTRALQLEKRIAEMDRRLALDLEPQPGDEENLGGRGFGARRTPQSNPRNE